MNWNRLIGGVLLACGLLAGTAQGAVQSKAVVYEDQGEALTGYLYWDDALEGKRPGILVVHEWWGLNDYAKKRARMLAELGYVAFAADMYGTGRVTDKPEQAREWMQEVTTDPEWWRARAFAGLAQLKAAPGVDTAKLAAVGYCFGGGTVIQMTYGGSDELKGVVSFHGSLPAAPEEANGKIKIPLLILHGQADKMVSPDVVDHFEQRLGEAGASWELDSYGGVRHSFTNPDADKRGIANLKYDALADKRSWARMQAFFAEIF
ncbi:dienelactone hydrolase family protein [Endothiovibrio diazotrophicus]